MKLVFSRRVIDFCCCYQLSHRWWRHLAPTVSKLVNGKLEKKTGGLLSILTDEPYEPQPYCCCLTAVEVTQCKERGTVHYMTVTL